MKTLKLFAGIVYNNRMVYFGHHAVLIYTQRRRWCQDEKRRILF